MADWIIAQVSLAALLIGLEANGFVRYPARSLTGHRLVGSIA